MLINESAKSFAAEYSFWLAVIFVLAISWIYRYLNKRREFQKDQAFGKSHGCQRMPILPYKWPLALDILKRQYDVLPSQKLLASYSVHFDSMPNFEFHLFGQIGYLTTDPRNLEAILSTNFEDWGLGSRRAGLFPMLGEGIFTQDGRPWKHSRELLRRQFVRINFKDLSTFDHHVDDLIASLSSSKGIVDLQPAFFRFTLATTNALLFGERDSILKDEDHDEFARCFDYASMISAIRLRLADLEWMYKPKAFRRACAVIKKYAGHFVHQALEQQDSSDDGPKSESQALILDLHQELQDADLVRDQLVHVLIAGRDTTACLMSWTFFMLVRRPPVLEKLKQEIQTVLPNGERLARPHLHKLTYLRCILNETLRLYPQLPINVRFALKTTLLPTGGGPDGTSPVLIPRGAGVGYSVYHMHRRKSIYGEDANEFRPERWESGELEHVGWGFMPFHGGPRICLGREFALMEASCGIVRILQEFPNVRLPEGVEKVETGQERQSLTIVISSAEGCKVLLS